MVNLTLRVICRNDLTARMLLRVTAFLEALGITERPAFSPYWKEPTCSVLEISHLFAETDPITIQNHIQMIAGGVPIQVTLGTGDWEFAYYASLDELTSTNDISFVVCSLFTPQEEKP